ncbi:hypothetical protein ACWEIK_15000 [Streptomyces sp. NPDC004673]
MALTGAAELVRACRAAVPVAVASNSPRELLDAALPGTDLDHDWLGTSLAEPELLAWAGGFGDGAVR